MVSLERYQVTHGIEGNYGKAGQVNEGEPRSQATENTGEVMPQAVQSEDFTGHTTMSLGPRSLSHVHLFETPMDCSLPGPSVHESLQARILEWVAYSQPTD